MQLTGICPGQPAVSGGGRTDTCPFCVCAFLFASIYWDGLDADALLRPPSQVSDFGAAWPRCLSAGPSAGCAQGRRTLPAFGGLKRLWIGTLTFANMCLIVAYHSIHAILVDGTLGVKSAKICTGPRGVSSTRKVGNVRS